MGTLKAYISNNAYILAEGCSGLALDSRKWAKWLYTPSRPGPKLPMRFLGLISLFTFWLAKCRESITGFCGSKGHQCHLGKKTSLPPNL